MSINEEPENFALPCHSCLACSKAYAGSLQWTRECFFLFLVSRRVCVLSEGLSWQLVEFTYKTSRPGVLFLGKVYIFDLYL